MMLTRDKVRRIVEGQILDFLKKHPEAVTLPWRAELQGKPRIVHSLSKRITGDLMPHVKELNTASVVSKTVTRRTGAS